MLKEGGHQNMSEVNENFRLINHSEAILKKPPSAESLCDQHPVGLETGSTSFISLKNPPLGE
jgi:hypothetical protein